jgi:hypothetical protein
MSVTNPAFTILRHSVIGRENEWAKMFDPPTESPVTRERLAPTNPVPEFCASDFAPGVPIINGASVPVPNTWDVTLMHGMPLPTWDAGQPGRPTQLEYFLIGSSNLPSPFSGGTFPGPTIRIPRGKIFHGRTAASGPPPHTVHWHGIEPTPMNDGVGHCSMELGQYTYQFQPNFIGSYFYHCHRNTMQHFEFGLYGFLIVEPPDAYDQQNPSLPNYAGGYPRRTAANLASFSEFPGFVGGDLASGDPHAMTVPYDKEALWVFDDRDSVWSANMSGPFDTFPSMGSIPGVNDEFIPGDFHDFNPDYFFVTGLPLEGPRFGSGTLNSNQRNFFVPPALNSGVAIRDANGAPIDGMQVPINANVNQTILVRVLDAAYVGIRVTFPLDVVIIAFDGRALGVPPFGQYNQAFRLNANTPFELSTARRFDALIRRTSAFSGVATVEYIDVRGGGTLFTGRIPINIT